MDDAAFQKLVEEGLDALPERVQLLMKNVAVVIADALTEEQRLEQELGPEETLLGLYEGVPQPERGIDYAALPDRITIFKEPILALYDTPEDIRACVENTVWHEVAHHFGFDEEWIAHEEQRRGKTQ